MSTRTLLRTFIIAAAMLGCASAGAQGLFRTYLSVTGSDANACTLGAPCRLLPAALAAVADGGEVWMLNSANYNTATVNITKSVTILAIPGVVGSVVSTGGTDALNIDTASVKVALRNLRIVRSGASNIGIRLGNNAEAAELKVADCEISDMNRGIVVIGGAAQIFVRNTVILGSAVAGFFASEGTSALDGVQLKGNGNGISVENARATVSNSVISENFVGVAATGTLGGSVARITIERSVVAGNEGGIRGLTSGSGASVEITVAHSVVTHNSTVGIDANQAASSTVTIVSDNNVLSENGIGFRLTGGAAILSRTNNTLLFNTTDVSGGTLTEMAGQ